MSLVPDGVTAVTISYAQAQRTFAVDNNFYSYTVAASADQRPSAIVWHLADGSTRRVP